MYVHDGGTLHEADGARLRRALGAAAAALLMAFPLTAQTPADPTTAQPERPTVATHAWTVAPGYLELESGVEWDRNPGGSHTLGTPTELKIGLAPRLQLAVQGTLNRPPQTALAPGDVTLVLKYRLADGLPLLGAFAVCPGVKLPAGSASHGTGTTDLSLLLISSHALGPVSLDINVGWTHRSGDGSRAPRDATLWTVSAGAPLRGSLGLAAEVFGYPRTGGPAGSAGTVAFLGGPTLALTRRLVLDLGTVIRVRGPQPNAWYAGLVVNLGRI